jgi:3-hydroxymyristoyl/3-hydroxydecanoyl-(acyl carrier protein) dehydratase
MIDPKSCIDGINISSLRTTQAPYRLSFILSESLPYFDGHFPAQPILPAVAVLDLSFEFLRIILSKDDLDVKEISSAKFYNVIQPKDKIDIEIVPKDSSTWKITWLVGDKKVADLIVTV